MSVLSSIRQRIAKPVKRFTRKARLARSLSPFLPVVTCVDVGASYYPHVKWALFLQSPQTRWLAVEPNEANIGYVEAWPYPSQVSKCTTGLSSKGGRQTLYVTNVDSGSSLLEPVIPASMARRMRNLDYFFPLRKQDIDTLTLADVLAGSPADAPVFVKLDTQGTELSILSGARALLESHRIVGIELEATLQAQPVMQGAGKFWEACQYLENLGFELLHVKPIYGPSRFGINPPRGLTFLNECDSVFAVRQDVAAGLSVECRIGLLAFYLSYQLFEEALCVLQEDAPVKAFLAARGCSVEPLAALIRGMA